MRVRNKWFTLILWTLIILITVFLMFSINQRKCRTPINQVLNPNKPMVALTFDDGPNRAYTQKVLDVLYENNAFGTFFISGQNISGNEDILKEMKRLGHEIENHTFSHVNLTMLSTEEIAKEFELTQNSIENVLPNYKFKYVRPPFGEYTESVEIAAQCPIVLWDIDSGDYVEKDEKKIYDNVVSSVKDGSIIVFHDDNRHTVAALEKIIPELQNRGFQFVTVSQILKYKN